MKQNYSKYIHTFFALTAMLILSACGSTGTSSTTGFVDGAIQGQSPYVINVHQGSTAVVHAGGTQSGTHSWVQVSGPQVTLTGANTSTVTFTAPVGSTGPVVLQHTNTSTPSGTGTSTTVTPHVINSIVTPPLPPSATPQPLPLVVVVGKPQTVYSGDVASLHASAAGGKPPYTYDWIAPGSITLNTTHGNAPTFTVPTVTTPATIQIGLQVMDADGNTISSNETITMEPAKPTTPIAPLTLQVPQDTNGTAGNPITITAVASGGDPTLTYAYTWYDLIDTQNPIASGNTFTLTAGETQPLPVGSILYYVVKVYLSSPNGTSIHETKYVTITIVP